MHLNGGQSTEMNLYKILQGLYAEKERLESIIVALEEMAEGAQPRVRKPRGHPGRKGMPLKERQEVSIRMKTYWAERRRKNAQSVDGN